MWLDLVSVRRWDVVVLRSEVGRGHDEVHVEVGVVILKKDNSISMSLNGQGAAAQ